MRQYLPCCKQGVSIHCKCSAASKYLDQLALTKYSCFSLRKLKYFDTLNGKKAALFPWSLLTLQFWWLKLQRKLPICYSVVFFQARLLLLVLLINVCTKYLCTSKILYLWQLGNHFLCFISLIQYCTKYPFFLSTNINFYAKWLLWKKLSLVCWLPLAVLETQGRHSICTEEFSVSLQIFLTLNMSLSHP